jgi:hypothetical protein
VSLVPLAALLALLLAHPTAAAEVAFTDLPSAEAAGATVQGPARTLDEARRALDLPQGAYLTLPTAGVFDPERGSIELWLRPGWPGDAAERHTFFHLGTDEARSHVTLFKTETATLRFVYKAAPEAWLGVDAPIAYWQPGSWHHLAATWLPMRNQVLLLLQVDGAPPRWAVGGARLADVPETLYIGARGPAGQYAQAAVSELRLTHEAIVPLPYAAGPKPSLKVSIDCAGGTAPLPQVHDGVTIWNTRQTPLPFAVGSPKHRRLQESGFKLARLVAYSEQWLWGVNLTRSADGKVHYDFTDFDALVDMVRAAGLQPYIRIAYHMPKVLSATPDSPNWAYSGPRDMAEWSDFVRAVVSHCNVERKLGVKYWVMTLNEADIAVSRREADWGTICKLYETSVRAGKEVDPTIKVGGPAICMPLDGVGGDALRRFVTFCRERSLPLDFICFHRYHVPHPRDFETHIDQVREIVTQADPQLQPEYILDEWNQWARTREADDEHGAAYVAAALQYFRRANLAKSFLCSFNDVMTFQGTERDLVSHQGPFDKTLEQVARFRADDLAADGVKRPCILAHAPLPGGYTFGRYTTKVPNDHPRLAFATGITAQHPQMDGVGFAIAVTAADAGTRIVFDHAQRTPAWQAQEASLQEFAGQTVEIEWRTDAGRQPGAQTIADWASWAEPKLISGPADQPQVALDFIEQIGEATTGVHQAATHFVYSPETIAASTGLPLIKGNVVTAPYFAFLATSRLTGNELPVSGLGRGGIDETDAAGVTGTGDRTGVRALVWTYDLFGAGRRDVALRFDRMGGLLKPGPVAVRRYLIDATHTNPCHDYVDQHQPDNGGLYNLQDGKLTLVADETVTPDADGSLTLTMTLPDFSVTLVEIEPAQ